jgi:hypothetical protein
MNTHFCGGKAVKTTFSLGLGNPNCGMEDMSKDCENLPSEQEQVSTKPCCENHHQVLQTDDTAKTQQISHGVNPVFFAALVRTIILPAIFSDKGQNTYAEYSPPLPERDVQVLFQTFLI